MNARNYYAARSTYVVFLIILGIPFLICLLAYIKTPATDPFLILIFLFVVFLLVLLWIKSFSLQIKEDCIEYHSLFKKTKIRFSDIQKAELGFGMSEYADRFKPTVRLTLFRKDPALPNMEINMKIFAREDMQSVLNVLSAKGLL